MKPIKISIKDFQSIESLDLELSGFTCITGPTNIGKSAVIRAISNAILNKSVVGAVRKGKKFCTVDVDGLKWEKGERVGRYWVPGELDESGNPKPRDGIGQGQTEVTEMMGFRSVKVGDKYINPWLATQFNPIFLMEDSGPAVTDFISDIAHLKSLQNAIIHCTRVRQRLLTSVKDKEAELVKMTAKEEALAGVDNLTKAEKDLVSQLESLEEYAAVIAYLRRTIAGIESEQRSIAALSDYSSVRVPKRPADPAESLAGPARTWTAMESAAVSISSIRAVSKVPVPEALGTEAVEDMRSLSRFLAIPSLEASVSALGPAASVSVPDALSSGSESLRGMASLLRSLTSARAREAALSGDVPDVPAPPSFADLSSAASLLRSMDECASAIGEHKASLEAIEGSIWQNDKEMAAIPTCPTCKQVFVQSHSHQA